MTRNSCRNLFRFYLCCCPAVNIIQTYILWSVQSTTKVDYTDNRMQVWMMFTNGQNLLLYPGSDPTKPYLPRHLRTYWVGWRHTIVGYRQPCFILWSSTSPTFSFIQQHLKAFQFQHDYLLKRKSLLKRIRCEGFVYRNRKTSSVGCKRQLAQSQCARGGEVRRALPLDLPRGIVVAQRPLDANKVGLLFVSRMWV